MELNLKDKVAIVTGSAQGVGKAIAIGLAEEGVHLVINHYPSDADQAKAEATAAELAERFGVKAVPVAADVSKEADVTALFDAAEDQLGAVNILVNNAGICPTSMVADMPVEMFTATINVNLVGTFLTSREMTRRLLKTDTKGKIINVASQAAFNGSATGKAHYAASKGGVVAFTVSLAKELASKGICVNAIAPGMVKTEMVAETLEQNAERYRKSIPLGRPAEPSEVAVAVTFLASEKADYITGATYDVSGGVLMR